MRKRPRASICIPVYNSGQFLRECLESALSQTFDDYEVIVSVDLGSTDNSEDILREFSDARLRIVRPQRRLGGEENLRFAVEASHGDYFNFRGANDNLFPEFLESQVEILDRHPNVAFAHSASEIIDVNGNVIALSKSIHRSFIRSGKEETKRYLAGPRAHGDTYLVRRSAYDAVGGFGPRTFFADWELALRLLCYGDVAYNERVLNQNRSWYGVDPDARDEQHSLERKLEFLRSEPDFYEYYEPYVLERYPDLRKAFVRARRKRALNAISSFQGFDEQMKKEARDIVLSISSSWLVHVKLALYDQLGFGFLWHALDHSMSWAKRRVKSLLYRRLNSC